MSSEDNSVDDVDQYYECQTSQQDFVVEFELTDFIRRRCNIALRWFVLNLNNNCLPFFDIFSQFHQFLDLFHKLNHIGFDLRVRTFKNDALQRSFLHEGHLIKNLNFYTILYFCDFMQQIYVEIVSVRNTVCLGMNQVLQLLMAHPEYLSLVSISAEFRHERNTSILHWMVEGDDTGGRHRAVGEIDPRNQTIKLRTRLIELLGDPLDIASLLASIAKEAWFFSPVKGEGFITVDELVHFINGLPFKNLFNDKFIPISLRQLIFYPYFSFLYYLQILRRKCNLLFLLYLLLSRGQTFLLNFFSRICHSFHIFQISKFDNSIDRFHSQYLLKEFIRNSNRIDIFPTD